jgi:hypothetical protein
MPWKERTVMDERMRFVIRLKDGESMASLCRKSGISRKTGYKSFERHEECGVEGLMTAAAMIAARCDKPHWGRARFASGCCADCRTRSRSRR